MKYIIFLLSIILISCSYSVYQSGYPHLKTISIKPFLNKTTIYELEENLFNNLSDYFIKDGRLKVVTISPDCTLEGEIVDYQNKIYKYSDSGVDEYQVSILFRISFIDLIKNNVIYNNDSLILKETYSQDDLNSDFSTEEEAQEEIFSDLFDFIIKKSLEEW